MIHQFVEQYCCGEVKDIFIAMLKSFMIMNLVINHNINCCCSDSIPFNYIIISWNRTVPQNFTGLMCLTYATRNSELLCTIELLLKMLVTATPVKISQQRIHNSMMLYISKIRW